MQLQFNVFNVLVLLGALQGIMLCLYLLFYKKNRPANVLPFTLFLFSLAFINLYYALMDIEFFAIFRAFHLFPFPAKWMIGPAIFLYIKSRFDPDFRLLSLSRSHLLFLPGFLTNLPFFYWFFIAWQENSYRIVQVIVETNFFRYNEVFSVLFNLILLAYIGAWINLKQSSVSTTAKEESSISWLKSFVWINLAILFVNLELVVIDLVAHDGQETRSWYYGLWILYTLFIYAIGFVGFSNAELLLKPFKQKKEPEVNAPLIEKLESLMKNQQLFKNPDLRLGEVAAQLSLSPKELSQAINTHCQMNFSSFVNQYRVEEVKKKLLSPDFHKFTIIHLAKEAGFNSKSTFNEIFKLQEGMSPSAYRKEHSRPNSPK